MLRFILITINAILISFAAFADSKIWKDNKPGDIVVVATINPGDNFTLVTNFVPFIDNSLKLKINGATVYSVSIEGSNSYNRNFLRRAKSNVESDLLALSTTCINKSINIIGELGRWDSSLFDDAEILVIYPPSLQAICAD